MSNSINFYSTYWNQHAASDKSAYGKLELFLKEKLGDSFVSSNWSSVSFDSEGDRLVKNVKLFLEQCDLECRSKLEMHLTNYPFPRVRDRLYACLHAQRSHFQALEQKQGVDGLIAWRDEKTETQEDRYAVYERIQKLLKPAQESGKLELVGDLDLTGCQFSSFPQNLVVEGTITMLDNHLLKDVPDTLTVEGDFYLGGALLERFSCLFVGGSLHIQDSPKLTTIADDLLVEGEFSLFDCARIKVLGEDIKVFGDCTVSSCDSFQAMPNQFFVEGCLTISKCQAFKCLHESREFNGSVFLGGDLSFEGCANLLRLPDWVYDLDSFLECLPRRLNIDGTAIRSVSLPEGMELEPHVDVVIQDSHQDLFCLDFIEALPGLFNHAEFQLEELKANWLHFLEKLLQTPSFIQFFDLFFDRLRVVLDKVLADSNFALLAHNVVYYFITTCQDAALSSFNQLEELLTIQNILLMDDLKEKKSAMKSYAWCLFKKARVEELAYSFCEQIRVQYPDFSEDLEVDLYFKGQLAKKIGWDFPDMLYLKYVETAFHEDGLEDAVEDAGFELDVFNFFPEEGVKFGAFLSTYEPYQKIMRETLCASLNYLDLSEYEGGMDLTEICPFTMSGVNELEEPVVFLDGRGLYLFEFSELKKGWIEKPENPTNRMPLDITQCKRVADK